MKINKIINLFSLKNKNIVITGAAGMLGRQHAEAIAAVGGLPILVDINLKGLKKLKNKINNQYKINSIIYKLDITKEKQIKKCSRFLIKKIKHIDGLINNAANNPSMKKSDKNNTTRLENFPLRKWNDDLLTSLTGSFLCAKYFGYEIFKNKQGGAILNISSDLGLIAPDQRLYYNRNKKAQHQNVKPVSYSVSKFGIVGLTKYLSTYWPKKVRCNVLCPGGIKTDQNKRLIKEIINRIPLGRMAQPDDYQAAVVFLLSDASKYLNGAVIPMDGGRTAW